jgi:sucrose-6-phosphate hydrolase SacC (GH32 family)
MAGVVGVIWAENEAKYLCRHGWTGQITLMRQEKLDFGRISNPPPIRKDSIRK